MTDENKHKKLKTVGVTVGILVFVTIFCWVVSLISVAELRTTEPYNHGVDLALKSPRVRQALGEPVTVDGLPSGFVNDPSEGGEAKLYIPLQGTNDSAKIRVNASYRDGAWKYWAIRVDTDSGERIDLLEP